VNEFASGAIAPGDKANTIIERRIKHPPWVWLGEKPDEATKRATRGDLVLGGLTSSEMTYIDRRKREHSATMGHVVVIAPGGPSRPGDQKLADGTTQPCRGGYPYCYQGAYNALYRIRSRTQVDLVFPSLLLDKVHYAYVDLSANVK
jgi:hypothetical protein